MIACSQGWLLSPAVRWKKRRWVVKGSTDQNRQKLLNAQRALELAQFSIEFIHGYVFAEAEEHEITEKNRHFEAVKWVLYGKKEWESLSHF